MRLALLVLVGLICAAPLTRVAAQRVDPSAQTVDRIVAVVGNKPILESQVEEQIAMMRSSGGELPSDSAGREQARHDILSQMIDEEILVQQAERDTSVRVTEQEVEDEVQKTVENVHRQFGSQQEFESNLHNAGFASEEEWRRWLTDSQRRMILQQRLIENLKQKNKLRPIPPSEAEMRKYWTQTEKRPQHPALITFRQIVISVHPEPKASARARAVAESLLAELRHGANFAELAKRHSADSSSRTQGGELGWFRRGVMVKPFEEAAFKLKPGEISNVVETEFGFHIIQVERIQPAEIEARHILIEPEISSAQVNQAHQLADSVHGALSRGTSFDSLARRYADPNESRIVEDLPAPQLPEGYPRTLATDSTTGIKPVFEIAANTAHPKFVVLQVTKWRSEGELTFEDVKDRLRDQMGQQLAVRHFIENLRRTTYVDIRQ
jgi:peptidyl-prolyl cis-trans isomerase SurA